MKRLLVAGIIVLVLAAGAVAALPLLVSSDWLRDRIVADLQRSTGLTLTLGGDVRLGVFPSLALEADDVALASGDAPAFAEVREVRVGLALAPLLSGRAALTGVTLVEPRISLVVGADGRRNWVPARAEAPVPEAGGNPAGDRPAGEGGEPLSVSIARITVEDGRLVYADERSGMTETLEDIDLSAALPDLSGPMDLSGAVTARSVRQTIEVTLGSPAALLQGAPLPVAGTIASDLARLSLDGRYDPAAARLDGQISVKDADTGAIAALAGAGSPPVDTVSLDGVLAAGGGRIELTDLSFTADGTTGTGEMAFDTAGERPRLDARLALDAVDLDGFAGSARETSSGGEGNGSSTPPEAGKDFPDLDAGIELTIGEIRGAALAATGPIQGARVVAILEKGTVRTAIGPLNLLDGTADLRATLKPDAQGYRIDGTLKAKGFDLTALAGLAGGAVPATGSVAADMAFAAVGRNAAEFRQTLGARGTIGLSKGTVTGLGLAAALGDPAADQLTGVDVALAVTSLQEPVRLTGAAQFRKQPIKLDVTVDPRQMTSGAAFPIRANVASKRMTLDFDGTLDPANRTVVGGVGIDAASLSAAMAVIGRPVSDLPPGKVAIFGRLDASPAAVHFADADFTLADTHIRGNVDVDLKDERPKLTARLAGKAVDLGALIGGASGAGAPADRSAGGQGDGGQEDGRPRGWSDEPLDLSGLRSFDADVAIAAERVIFAGTKAGPARVTLKNTAGVLDVEVPEMAIHGGTGTARLTLDARKQPGLSASLRLRDAEALPLLAGAAGFTRIEGRLDADLDVAAVGSSVFGLVSGLNGGARLAFRDGALRGIDLAGLLQSAAVSVVTGFGQSSKAKTAFHSLTGTFRIENGQVSNDDLRLDGPLVRGTGAGRIDLPGRRLGYRVVPTLAARNGAEEVTFEVPVIIEGPWDAVRIYPDVAGILENPEAAYDKLRKLGGAFARLGKDAGKADLGTILEQLAPAIGGGAQPGGPQGGGQAGGGQAGGGQPGGGQTGGGDPLGQVLDGILQGGRQPPSPPPEAPPAQGEGPMVLGPEGTPPPAAPAPPADPVDQLIQKGLDELFN